MIAVAHARLYFKFPQLQMPLSFKPLIGTTAKSSTLKGILFMVASISIFSCVNAFSKMMVATYPPAQVFFIRGFGALAVLLPFLARNNFAAARDLPRPGVQALRMAFSVADGMLFFTAIKFIPLADATTCYLAAPIFVTAFSAIFLREHVGWRRWSAVVVGFIGVLIALRPTGATFFLARADRAGRLSVSVDVHDYHAVRPWNVQRVPRHHTGYRLIPVRRLFVGIPVCAADVGDRRAADAQRHHQCCGHLVHQPVADAGAGERCRAVSIHHDHLGDRARLSGVRRHPIAEHPDRRPSSLRAPASTFFCANAWSCTASRSPIRRRWSRRRAASSCASF